MNTMLKDIKIKNKIIGESHPILIVAEMSGNHNQDLHKSLNIIQSAYECGVSALKIQTYDENTLTLNSNLPGFIIHNQKSLWANKNLYNLYKEAKTPREFHKPIFDKCKELGLICFSTPFHESDVDYLEQNFNPDIYKIASFEIVHIPLIKYIAQTKKPVIMSTGMASFEEIMDAVCCLRQNGCDDIVLLKCTSSYPANPRNSNIKTLPMLKNYFNAHIGLSDHTMGLGTALASVAYGAEVIEKHFTLDRKDGGVDSAFSAEPNEMKQLVKEVGNAWLSLGSINFLPTDEEKSSLGFRRSIYAVKDIKIGEILTKDNIKVIRPGYGLMPVYYENILGKKIKNDIVAGMPITLDVIFE